MNCSRASKGDDIMRILTYKRTHIGDPDKYGRFGINDCMGRIRSLNFDAVIGVGGIGREPRSLGIDRKITWIGLYPKRATGGPNRRAAVVTFKQFLLLDEHGPLLESLAPRLARKIYDGRRFILNSYSREEKAEAVAVVEWAMQAKAIKHDQSKCRPTAQCRRTLSQQGYRCSRR